MKTRTAIIAGAGPAGLTAALELLRRTDIVPIVVERDTMVGGISRTVSYNGNRMDLGGHRFFSKSDRVMRWWLDIMPFEKEHTSETPVSPQNAGMLHRNRQSRILYRGHLFDYPLSLNIATLSKLGLASTIHIGASYLKTRLSRPRTEKSLEDFFINRFGTALYKMFFKDYTEKVWGVACNAIKPEWGRQRIKAMSVSKVVLHAIRSIFSRDVSVGQKNVETSLIGHFMYPRFGPGHFWQRVADMIVEKGGTIILDSKVCGLHCNASGICGAQVESADKKISEYSADYFFSGMPINDLIAALDCAIPENLHSVARALPFRSFIAVGLLVRRMKTPSKTSPVLPDTWIYIQEPHMRMGRLQIFNNWSPSMVKDATTGWLGCEYFADENDELWNMPDSKLVELAGRELEEMDLVEQGATLDGTVVRVDKAYPAYFGGYENFDIVKKYIDGIPNLFAIGRNGMHKYNNQDHAMLTAMSAVDIIAGGAGEKAQLWEINTEEEYHEEKS